MLVGGRSLTPPGRSQWTPRKEKSQPQGVLHRCLAHLLVPSARNCLRHLPVPPGGKRGEGRLIQARQGHFLALKPANSTSSQFRPEAAPGPDHSTQPVSSSSRSQERTISAASL